MALDLGHFRPHIVHVMTRIRNNKKHRNIIARGTGKKWGAAKTTAGSKLKEKQKKYSSDFLRVEKKNIWWSVSTHMPSRFQPAVILQCQKPQALHLWNISSLNALKSLQNCNKVEATLKSQLRPVYSWAKVWQLKEESDCRFVSFQDVWSLGTRK